MNDLKLGGHFNGPDYDPEKDHARLTGQIKRVHDCMIDGHWRTLRALANVTGDPEASVSAQLRHLRKDRFGSFVVNRRRVESGRATGLFEYQLLPPESDD